MIQIRNGRVGIEWELTFTMKILRIFIQIEWPVAHGLICFLVWCRLGFKDIGEVKLREIRKVYEDKNQLLKDLSERIGRNILHELKKQ